MPLGMMNAKQALSFPDDLDEGIASRNLHGPGVFDSINGRRKSWHMPIGNILARARRGRATEAAR
ncbi:hypothetical protein CO659_02450 [Rhizobium sp. S9]|nr:hypothetical protein CO659_02450 [Rhizobium sp. S9]